MQSDYYRHGFDAMINFDYRDQAAKASGCLSSIDLTGSRWRINCRRLTF